MESPLDLLERELQETPRPKPAQPINQTAFQRVIDDLLENAEMFREDAARKALIFTTADTRVDWWIVWFADIQQACGIDGDLIQDLMAQIGRSLELYFWHDPDGRKSVYELMITVASFSARVDFFVKVNARQQGRDIFLCRASEDKQRIRTLYQNLSRDGLSPWLDETQIPAGATWEKFIRKSIRRSRSLLICLSNVSVRKTTGYLPQEIKMATAAAEKRFGRSLFVVPARLDDCAIPEELQKYQWVDLFQNNGYDRLIVGLRIQLKQRPRSRLRRWLDGRSKVY